MRESAEKRGDFAAIKSLLLLRSRGILDDFFRHAEIVVNLLFDVCELCRRDRSRLVCDRRIVVFRVRDDNARSVVLHTEVVPDKVVSAAV